MLVAYFLTTILADAFSIVQIDHRWSWVHISQALGEEFLLAEDNLTLFTQQVSHPCYRRFGIAQPPVICME